MIKVNTPEKSALRIRINFILILIIVLFLTIIVKVLYIQIIEGDYWNERYSETMRKFEELPKRGEILSRKGEILVTSIPSYRLTIDLRTPGWKNYLDRKGILSNRNESQLDSLCKGLAPYLPGYSVYQIKAELINRYKRKEQFYFPTNYNDLEYNAIKALPILREGKFTTGLVANSNMRRVKPFKQLASRTLGTINEKEIGNVGIEAAYNTELRGTPGEVLKQKLPGGIWIPRDDNFTKTPEQGYDLITSIDVQLQDITHTALKRQMKRHRAHHGTAVLMEVQTGNILAIANLTDTLDDFLEFYNYAVGESTEPGSTIKLPSFLALLEDGHIELSDSVDTGTGIFEIYGRQIKDTKEDGYGKLTLEEAFKVSSNIGVVKTVLKYYADEPQKFIDRLNQMGLNKALDIEIPGEPIPLIRSPKDKLWWQGSLAQLSYGYESTLTPLQILAFYNAIANNAKMVKPRFVKGLSKEGKLIQEFKPEVIIRSICSRSSLKQAKILLESVVDKGWDLNADGERIERPLKGTAYNLDNNRYKIAGKTGTAQVAFGKTGYDKKVYQASFVGYFPAENPKYSCIVVINRPLSGQIYGNVLAGGVFKEISDYVMAYDLELSHPIRNNAFAYEAPISADGYKADLELLFKKLKVPTYSETADGDWVSTYCRGGEVSLKQRIISDEKILPNVTGMGLKDALYILENRGLRVSIEGYGRVKRQIPEANTPYQNGMTIKLILS